ncbi:[sulfur carrier protein ThiS] adenylyltransferase [Colwellia chukchiensis]|uniref:[sulfur carrier protein ThiS] adenylyltransferase n=1 Tax=Colwellia chukchiensis TaxID=641665 RepID=A0A1H7JKW9_9GAMM|nr:HesA/MoeB/ThiF family protein [Colwellia chukchiensis]SEK74610.1 [sulfur carrier protein ThiS] adenylyltransferase [Colwellia chukchiensis]
MLSPQEQIRYSRQTMLKGIGNQGQQAIKNARVLIIGLGGLGNPVSLYLNAAGVGTIYLVDGDQIELSNLHRQIQFSEQDIGANKADISAEKLQQLNDNTNIEVLDEMLDDELADYYLPLVDLVLDCTDNINSRYLINRKCIEHKKPLIIGAATGFDGQHLFVDPNCADSACYQCLFPSDKKAPVNNCQSIGILGPVLGIIGGMQALQALKLLTGNPVATNQLHMFDGLTNSWQKFSLKKQATCPVCAG